MVAVGCENGIILDDNKAAELVGNRVEATSTGIGIEVSGNRVTESIKCIQLGGSGLLVRDNVVADRSAAMEIGAGNSHVEGNVLTSSGVGLRFLPQARGNVYRANTCRGNNADFVDEGSENTSHGDNYMPSRM